MNDGAVTGWEQLGKELLVKGFGYVLLELSIIYPKEVSESLIYKPEVKRKDPCGRYEFGIP